jgi:hypothetical protein
MNGMCPRFILSGSLIAGCGDETSGGKYRRNPGS